jgi:PKD repeat protein
MMTRIFTLLFCCAFSFTGFSQLWVDMMHDPNANFYETQAEFNSYWSTHTIEKGKGYKQFRRWEEYMEPRVYPKGDTKQAAKAYEEFQKYYLAHPIDIDALGSRAAAWVPMGPSGAPTGGGAGRVNFVRFDPANSNIVFVGSPAGGLWKSTNSGVSYTTNTDQLSVIGCTDVAIDPTNSNIMYLATGDGDAGDTYSIGILKSTDGGTTWNTTGLTWTVNQGRTISKLLINPSNTQIVLAATSNGIYRTTNGGTSWTQVQTGNFQDIEFKPTDANTVYACGTTFWLSTNAGLTFTQITTGVPAVGGVGRLAIAVTPANINYVYILAANNTNSGFLGVYRSTNSGTSFTTRSTTPNILGWDNGGDTGGQGWYDLAIAVSNTNADDVYTGGVNIWRSTNGGTTWTLNSHWYGGYSKPYVHADIHDLVFLPGSGTTLWSGNDGGVFRTTTSGTSYSDLSANLQIAQQYKIGLSALSATQLVTGHQDNGTNRYNAGAWTQIYGGDGMACFIDRTNNATIYASYVYGDFQRSTNTGATWTNIITGLTGTAAWVTPWAQDPVVANTLYAGYTNMFKSTNQGTSWSQIGTLTGTNSVVEFDVAPSNTQYIYAVKSNAVFKTTNGGTSWTNVTATLPVASAALTNVEICPTDPLKVWVTFSGYSSGNKVFMTTNGGTSWTNYSTGLPNIPANCIVYQTGSTDGVYVGTDVGVYYRDNSLSTWQPYFAGLPNVIVKDLEIYYGTGKLRAATYGRSTWETDLYSAGTSAPVADFTSDRQVICAGQTVNFTDLSAYVPTSWSWSFTGGTPATSTLQNPSIVYNTPGTYAVTLTATNVNGSDVETKTAYITVSTIQSLPVVEGFEAATFAPTNWFINDDNGNGLTWTRNGALGAWGTSTACAMFDNYNMDDAGARDELTTAKYDFSAVTSATMTFDVAYARYNATYSDSLAVMVSTDCGLTFTQVWMKGGTTLATGPDLTTLFTPTTAQWRNESIDLSAYAGQPDVMIAFQNRARYGNALYLDNVNITAVMGSLPVADFTGSPTTVCAGSTVTFTNTSSGATSYSWTFSGGTPGTSTATNPTVTYNTPGTYNVTLAATNASGTDTEIKTAYITVVAAPTTSVAGVDQTVCAGTTATMAGNTPTVGTGLWTKVSGPAGGTITTPGSPTTTITALVAGTYVYQWTITNAPCTASSDQMSIIVSGAPTTATAGIDQTVCAGTTVTMAGNTPTTGTGLWTKISGPAGGTITTPGSPTTTITALVAGTYVYQWTISNAPCTASSDQMSIIVSGAPTTAAAGIDQTVCEGTTVTMAGNTPTTGTGVWTKISGPAGGTITTPGSPTTTITALVAGTYVYQWTISNAPCTASSDQMSIIVSGAPTTAAAGIDQTVCEGTTVTMAGNTPTTGTGVWTKISGPAGGTITTPSSPTSTITALVAGTYVYQWTISNAPCTATSDQMSIIVSGAPTTAAAGIDQTICTSAGGVTMAGNTATSGTGIWTQVSGPASTITTPSSPTTTVTGMGTVGTYVYQWTISNAPCTASSDQMTVTVTAGPTTAAAGIDQTVCAGTTVTMAGNTPVSGTGLWTKVSGPAGGTITTASSPTTTITALVAGTYVYQWTISGAPCPASTDQMSIIVSGTPTTAAAGIDQTICTSAGGVTMAGNTATSGTGVWTQVSGPASTITTPSSPTTTVTGMVTVGTYVYQWTITNAPCTASSDQMTVIVTAGPTTAAAGIDQTVCAGTTVTMAGNTPVSGTGLWTKISGPAGGTITTPTSPTSTITALVAGTYVYQWTISGAPCPASTDQMSIIVSGAPTTAAAGIDQTICTSAGGVTMAGNTATSGTGVWTQVSGPASTITTPSSPTTTVTGMGTVGTYVYQWTISNAPCTASSDQMTVTVTAGPTTAAAGIDQTVCAGTTVTMAGNTPVSGTGLWTKISGPAGGTITTASSPTTTITALVAGTYVYQWTISGAPCPASTDQMSIIVSGAPTTAAAGTDQTICGSTTTLAGNTPTTGTGTWTFISGPATPTITTPTSATSGITGMSATGAYVFQWTITNAPCTASSDQVTINVTAAPIALATSNSPVCATDTIFLYTPTVTGATYFWDGPGTYTSTSQNPVRPNATTGMGGTYLLTVTLGTCTATSSVVVTVNALPGAAATNTSPVCEGNSFSLNTSTVSAATYAWSGPLGYTASIKNPTITGATVAMSGVYTVVVTKTATGCQNSSSTTVTINPGPGANAANTGPYCAGSTINLSTSTVAGASYSWSGPLGFTSSLQNPIITGSTSSMSGMYIVTVTLSGCSSVDTTIVVVDDLSGIIASNDGPVCEANTLNLNATTVSGATYSWTGPLGFTSALQNPVLSPTTLGMSGTYTVTVTLGACVSTSNTTITINPGPTANAGTDQFICEDDTVALNASGGGTYSWSPSTGLSSTTVANPDANPSTTTMYYVTVTSGLCSSTDSVLVTVSPLPVTPTITISNDTLFANPPGGFSYQWYLNGSPISGAVSSQYIFTLNGDYTVVITDGTSCSSGSAITTVTTAGIGDLEHNNGMLAIYPNPNNGNFTVTINTLFGNDCDLRITNGIGQTVYSRPVMFDSNTRSFQLNVTGIARGAYTLTVVDGDKRYNQKLIID